MNQKKKITAKNIHEFIFISIENIHHTFTNIPILKTEKNTMVEPGFR